MSREPIKRPPLLTAISDPSLVTPANSALLTQLLTNSKSISVNYHNNFTFVVDTQTNIFAQSRNLGSIGTTSDQSLYTSVHIKEETPQAQGAAALIITPVAISSSQSSLVDPVLIQTKRKASKLIDDFLALYNTISYVDFFESIEFSRTWFITYFAPRCLKFSYS